MPGCSAESGKQGPGIKKCGIVGVILDGDEVYACVICQLGKGERKLCVFGRWIDADAEERWVVLCVCHGFTPFFVLSELRSRHICISYLPFVSRYTMFSKCCQRGYLSRE